MKRVFIGICLYFSCSVLSGCEHLPDSAVREEVNEYVKAVPIDFSYVGYRKGEAQIPSVKTFITLEAPEDGSDATDMIQRALDAVPAPGAVLRYSGQGPR